MPQRMQHVNLIFLLIGILSFYVFAVTLPSCNVAVPAVFHTVVQRKPGSHGSTECWPQTPPPGKKLKDKKRVETCKICVSRRCMKH